MNAFIKDLRFGMRQLASKPGFAAAAIVTLALGIGANTAVFSVLNGYLFKPLPYPHSAQLARVLVHIPKLRKEPLPQISMPMYRVINEQTDAFSATAIYTQGTSSIIADGRAKYVSSIYASASLFDVLGIKPLLGRTFTAENNEAGNTDVALISYALWRNGFGADPNVIGKRVPFDDGSRRVIGVMPEGFAFPDRSVALWVPRQIMPDMFSPDRIVSLNDTFIGRLKPGVGADAADVQVQHAVSRYIRDQVPAQMRKLVRGAGLTTSVESYRQMLLGDRPTTLWLLQGAVLLILLMTCVNVANLLLSRMLGRSHEIAIRSTLGATRNVLARQLLGEALCLTVPGGLVGVALSWLALQFLNNSAFGTGNTVFSATLDWRVGLFVIGVVLITAVLVSVLPIRHLAKTDLQAVLQEGSRTSGGSRRTKRIRAVLVAGELTLATGLLAMAGLLLHSFMNLENVDPGFRKDHVLMASLLVPENDHPGDKALSSFYADLNRRIAALPGVRQSAMASVLPLMGGRQSTSLPTTAFFIPGHELIAAKVPLAIPNFVTSDYFKALGIPILRGRGFDARDASQPTAIIDAGLAAKYFPGEDPIGQQISYGEPGNMQGGARYTIVGVVPSIKYAELSTSSASTTIYRNTGYVSEDQGPSRIATVLIHTAMDPDALIAPLQNLIATMDPNVAVFDVHTMQEQLADSLRHKQTTMTLLLAFGGIALALAIVGVYGVMSYAVGQRRAECGVRLALGALPEELSWLVLKDGLRLLAVGLVLGLGLAVLFGYLLSAQLFGVAPFDPVTLIGSAVVLCAITLAACWLPARRAAKLDPAVAIMEQ
ncbi:MAG TPA: ABC transporter permease [Gammaproteobacteria bacterium]|nr:ABC transporter permease [Gammaproteobacteria bacterium]